MPSPHSVSKGRGARSPELAAESSYDGDLLDLLVCNYRKRKTVNVAAVTTRIASALGSNMS